MLVAFGALFLASTLASGADEPATVSGFARVSQGQLSYESRGAGCAVVLIGGGGGMDLRQWDAVFHALAPRYRVVRVDPRGVGRSTIPAAPYSNVGDLEAVLDFLGLETAVLVGVSSGGGIALDFALVHPERVSGLVLSAPLVRGFEMSEEQKKRVAGFAQAGEKGVQEGIRAFLDDAYFVPAPDNPEARGRARKLMEENARDVPPGLAVELDPPAARRVATVRAPALLLVGQLDHPDIHRRMEFLRASMGKSTLVVIPRGGHMLNLEKPADFAAAADRFLRTTACRDR